MAHLDYNEWLLVAVFTLFVIVGNLFFYMITRKQMKERKKYLFNLTHKGIWTSDTQILRDIQNKDIDEITGIYVLRNNDKNLYYVGQSIKVFSRVKSHLTGSNGNADIYADRKYGDSFDVKVIPLSGSEFEDLNTMERHYISAFNSYEKGYNKTRGNNRN